MVGQPTARTDHGDDLMYDPDAPAGFQDADLEMAELTDYSNALSRARRAGVCTHGATQRLRCTDGCDRQFTSDAEWLEARDIIAAEHGA